MERHRYTNEQLEQYYDRICFPKTSRKFDVSDLNDGEQLSYLNLLQKHQLVKVPWENLTQHYSWHRTINTSPRHLFNKIVPHPGRGGYCMEANHFFFTVLYSLNYSVYLAGARIYKGSGVYGGWTHCVNLVTIGGRKYLLDGGFGPQGPTRALEVRHDVPECHIGRARTRMMYERLPQCLDEKQRMWVYQHRRDESEGEWAPMYCFTELEFTPTDIESMNFSPWLNPQTFFTHKVVANRFTTSLEPLEHPGSPSEEVLEGEIDGSLTLNQDVLKWRRMGEKVLEWRFKDDGERQVAMERFFGIVLEEEDREAIKGTAAEVAARGMDHD